MIRGADPESHGEQPGRQRSAWGKSNYSYEGHVVGLQPTRSEGAEQVIAFTLHSEDEAGTVFQRIPVEIRAASVTGFVKEGDVVVIKNRKPWKPGRPLKVRGLYNETQATWVGREPIPRVLVLLGVGAALAVLAVVTTALAVLVIPNIGGDGAGPGAFGPGRTAASLTASPGSGPPGATVSLSGAGFAPGEPVELNMFPEFLGMTTASPAGDISNATVVIPDSLEVGTYRIEATGRQSGQVGLAAFQVTANDRSISIGNPTSEPEASETAAPREAPPPEPTEQPVDTSASLAVSPAAGPAGSFIDIAGTGFNPGESVEFRFFADTLGTATADSFGAVALTTQIPDFYGNFPRSYEVSARGLDSWKQATAPYEVTP
jgi:hypothetical protein